MESISEAGRSRGDSRSDATFQHVWSQDSAHYVSLDLGGIEPLALVALGSSKVLAVDEAREV